MWDFQVCGSAFRAKNSLSFSFVIILFFRNDLQLESWHNGWDRYFSICHQHQPHNLAIILNAILIQIIKQLNLVYSLTFHRISNVCLYTRRKIRHVPICFPFFSLQQNKTNLNFISSYFNLDHNFGLNRIFFSCFFGWATIHKWNNKMQAVKMVDGKWERFKIKTIYQMEKAPVRQWQKRASEEI